jgi:hypothetical protein
MLELCNTPFVAIILAAINSICRWMLISDCLLLIWDYCSRSLGNDLTPHQKIKNQKLTINNRS